nr:spermatogenesis-associated protein 22-like isoform X2 [Lytechinus pictus]
MQSPSEKNIIPIFNKRKRPRQALYAFPGQGLQNTTGFTDGTPHPASYSQQTLGGYNHNVQPAGRNGGNNGWQDHSLPQQPLCDGRTATWQGTKPSNQRMNAALDNPKATSLPYQPRNQPNTNQGNQHQSTNIKRPLQPWQQKYGEPSAAKSSRPSASPSPQSSQIPYAHSYSVQEPQRAPYTSVHQPGMYQQAVLPPTMHQSSTHQPGTSNATKSQVVAASPRQRPDPSHSHTGSFRGSAPSPFRMPSTSLMPQRQSQPGTAAWEMRNPESAGNSVDKSMKMLTVSIEELRYWTSSRDIQGLLFFELFGILNSAVCSNETGLAKKFTLKDGNHTLLCIFYETDRPLGSLTRGQCLRSVGNILPKEGIFRCVSVRPATLPEQKIMRSAVAACDRGVRQRLSATGVEP